MPMTASAPSLYAEHKAVVVSLQDAPTPWAQEDSLRPVYDANRRVVSFTVHAPRIVAAINLVNEIASGGVLGGEVESLVDRARKIMGSRS